MLRSGNFHFKFQFSFQLITRTHTHARAHAHTHTRARAPGPVLLFSGQYCGQSSGANYGAEDLTTSGASTFSRNGNSLAGCESNCRATPTCSYFSFTLVNSGDCLLYSACAAGITFGDGQQGTVTYMLTPQGTQKISA